MDRVGERTAANNWEAPDVGHLIGERGIAINSVGNIFHATHDGAGENGLIRAFSPDGTTLWIKEFTNVRPGILGVTAHDELLAQVGADLVAWNINGDQVWREPGVGRPVIDASGNIYVSGLTTPKIVSFTSEFGLRWELPLAEAASVSVDFSGDDGRVYVRADNRLLAVNGSGGIVWTFEAGASLCIGAALDAHGHVFLQDEENTAYLLDTCVDYAAAAWPKAVHGNRRHTHKAQDVLSRPGDCEE